MHVICVTRTNGALKFCWASLLPPRLYGTAIAWEYRVKAIQYDVTFFQALGITIVINRKRARERYKNTPQNHQKTIPNGLQRHPPDTIWAPWGPLWTHPVFQDPLGRHFSSFWLHFGFPWGTLLEAFWPLVLVLVPKDENWRALGGPASEWSF